MASVRTRQSFCVVGFAGLVLVLAARASAQGVIDSARHAMTAAAYEDALSTLSRLNLPLSSPEGVRVAKYRALCLLALSREDEAEAAVKAVMRVDPLYEPDNTDVSPQVKSEYASVRRRLLPSVVSERYAQAKAAFDAKNYSQASREFRTTIDMIDAFPLNGDDGESVADLRRLAAGFFDLSVQLTPAASPAHTEADVICDVNTPGVLPPKPLRQPLGSVQLFKNNLAGRSVLVEVVVDEIGRVESAVVKRAAFGPFDEAVVRDILEWRYEAAVLNGSPVPYRYSVQVSIPR
jgi:hypothetical protein